MKLENLLLHREGYVRITDFGLSKDNMDAYTYTNTVCGTPQYMAPEILRGSSYSRAVDWWALGVLMFEMLTGTYPFNGDNVEELFCNIIDNKLVFPSSLKSEAQFLLNCLLVHDPEYRLGFGEQAAEEVKANEFFDQFNFEALLAKKIPAPFVPKLKNAEDVSYFHNNFTKASPNFTRAKGQPKICEIDQNKFSDFN